MEQRRGAIIDSCWYLLQRTQPQDLTVKQILTNLGIAKSGFYRLFANRDELYLHMWQSSFRPILDAAQRGDIAKVSQEFTFLMRNIEKVVKLKRIEAVLSNSTQSTKRIWLDDSQRFHLMLESLPQSVRKQWLLIEGMLAIVVNRQQCGMSDHKTEWLTTALS